MGCGATKESVSATHNAVLAKVQKLNVDCVDDDANDEIKTPGRHSFNPVQKPASKPGFQQVNIKYSDDAQQPKPDVQRNTSNKSALEKIDTFRSHKESVVNDQVKSSQNDLFEPSPYNTSKNNLFESG
jgi:hypothetical protein